MIPPVGRKAIKACRRVYASIEEEPAEEVEAEADGATGRVWMLERRSGRRGGSAERVAACRCWCETRRHALKVWITASESGIYHSEGGGEMTMFSGLLLTSVLLRRSQTLLAIWPWSQFSHLHLSKRR
jgi:hypothetical protein